MDWTRCTICQSEDTSSLSCPQNGKFFYAYEVYKNFLDNYIQFKTLGALPIPVSFGEHETPESFMENKASWHRNCQQKFNQRGNMKKKKNIKKGILKLIIQMLI